MQILFNRRQEKICVNDRLHTNHYSTRDVREEWEYESTINLIRNYQKRISLFKKSELIVQGEVIIKGSKKKCYYLPEEKSHFQLIELDTLRYLVNTSNSEVIKVYAYLLNKSQNFVNYSFTGKELAIAIGYDYKQKNTKNKIKDIILFLENNGLLVKSNYYEKVGQNGSLPVPRMRIVEVNTKVKGA